MFFVMVAIASIILLRASDRMAGPAPALFIFHKNAGKRGISDEPEKRRHIRGFQVLQDSKKPL